MGYIFFTSSQLSADNHFPNLEGWYISLWLSIMYLSIQKRKEKEFKNILPNTEDFNTEKDKEEGLIYFRGMLEKTEHLPYFKTQNSREEKEVFKFLKRSFNPSLKKTMPQHYLIQQIPRKKLQYIKESSKEQKYFLRFDIKTYYPSINHGVLIENLGKNYKNITGREPSRRLKKYIQKEIPEFLSKSPYKKGISIGSPLSYILTGLFLLDLDLKIKSPFLRHTDDYVVFFKKKKEPELFLKNILIPTLQTLNLEINEKKLKSGRTNREKLDFIGFEYYSGYFRIKEEKKVLFKKKIVHLTNLSRKKTEKQILKELNNKILGFGHYYKHCSCKKDFEKLDAFIRMRTRRYFSKSKDSKNKKNNLKILTSPLPPMLNR